MAHDESSGVLLWQVANRWQAAQRAALKPYGLTHVQFMLLSNLVRMGGTHGVRQRELAGQAGTDPMMTSQVVRALEARGLVTREVHPGDGRAWAVRATRAGTSLSRRAGAAAAACDAEFFADLGRGATGLHAAL